MPPESRDGRQCSSGGGAFPSASHDDYRFGAPTQHGRPVLAVVLHDDLHLLRDVVRMEAVPHPMTFVRTALHSTALS